MRSREAFAVLLAELTKIVVFFLEYQLGSIPAFLVRKILEILRLSDHRRILVSPLLGQDIVLILDDEAHVVLEVLEESVELR